MTDAAMTSTARVIQVDSVLPHSPETIWKALTSGDAIARWLKMAPTGFVPEKGNPFTFQTTPAGEWDGTIQCQIVDLVPNECLSYTWQSGHEGNAGYGSKLATLVTWTLSSAPQGTRVQLVHSGFVTPKNDSAYKAMSGGWTHVLQNLGEVAGLGA